MPKKYSAPAVEKLLDIVEFLAKENRGFSLNEISRTLDIPINTVYRICREMEERQYLDKNQDNGLYQLGAGFYMLGQLVGSRISLRTQAIPVMEWLRDQLDETIHLCILQENRMILLEQIETRQPIRIHVEPGFLMFPYASAFGKCLLAFCDEETRDRIIKEGLTALTPKTVTDAARLSLELEEVRSSGIAFDFEEYLTGVRCVGAPVHAEKGLGIASIGVMGPAYRFSEKRMQQAGALVREAAGRLSAAMGCPLPSQEGGRV